MSTSTDFEQVVEDYKWYLRRIASSQHIRGMDSDDIMAEMTLCLWKAHQTWDAEKNPSLKNYWWRLWANRRHNIVRDQSRRLHPLYTDDLSLVEEHALYERSDVPEPPQGFTRSERLLWHMLAVGYTRQDIVRALGMSEWKYKQIIRAWRDHPVLAALVYEA